MVDQVQRRPILFFPRKTLYGVLALTLTLFAYYGLSYYYAQHLFQQGVALQKEMKTEEALEHYRRSLVWFSGPQTHYEIGWSYWVLQDWAKVITHWERAIALGVDNADLKTNLQMAKNTKAGLYKDLVRVDIGTHVKSDGEEKQKALSLKLVARFQKYNPMPASQDDHYEEAVYSPKSVRFHPQNNKVYVNSLEGYETLVFDRATMSKIKTISHHFDVRHKNLFHKASHPWLSFPSDFKDDPNQFDGKPVESVLSADGRYLWVPYYRRSFDAYGQYPSAVSLIDTQTDEIVRIFPTGTIPKIVAASPDGKWLAITNWGDNTVTLIQTIGKPEDYKIHSNIVVEKRFDLSDVKGRNRDSYCGFCLRGTVFTKDSKYLLVARMKGGGVAVLDVKEGTHIGTVRGKLANPRHLVLSKDGKFLYVSTSASGYVSKYDVKDMLKAAKSKEKRVEPLYRAKTGSRTRTIDITPDGKYIFAAVNQDSKIVALSADNLDYLFDIPADSYPVGL
ncbi:MAG: beta-propeller fold lactonase family protein, partial [Gammaproteobacteria bacterium]|nr:beta-propeller fold lactonase family protein [Gammaproteobacteria bacterium]